MKTALAKTAKYFNDISELEKLERRTSQEWANVGTIEEAVRMVEFKERKARNNFIASSLIIIGSAMVYKGTKKLPKDDNELKSAFWTYVLEQETKKKQQKQTT